MYHDAEKAEVFNKYLCSASAGKQEQKKNPSEQNKWIGIGFYIDNYIY